MGIRYRKAMRLGPKASSIIIFLFAAMMFTTCFGTISQYKESQELIKVCTASVNAAVTNVTEHRYRISSKNGRKKYRTDYRTTLVYTVDGKEYSAEITYSSRPTVGASALIKYDPNEPSTYIEGLNYESDSKVLPVTAAIFGGVGIFLVISGIKLLLKGIRQ